MAQNVFVMIDQLVAGLQEIKSTLAPLAMLGGPAGQGLAPQPKPAAVRRPVQISAPEMSLGATAAAAPSVASAPVPGAAPSAPSAPRAASSTSEARYTPEAIREQRVLQARYMNVLASLNALQKNQVKKIRAEQGYQAAFDLAATMQPE